MILELKIKEPDTFSTRIKSGKAFNFGISIERLNKATITIKFELRSYEEIAMLIK